MKVEIINEDYILFKQNILYRDDDFYVYKPLIYNEIQVILRNEEEYYSIEELPEYIREIVLKEMV